MAAEDVEVNISVAVPKKPTESQAKSAHHGRISKEAFTLEILLIIKDAQQQHGLRHGDFQRYRSYCARRLRRIRKSLHFSQGSRHKFQQKKVTKEVLNDVRYLYIPLVTAERAWSYAMQLKQEANTEPRKRFHLMSRLKKAVRHACDLEKICESARCDARTKLEAKAYSEWMNGLLQFEMKNWLVAMEHFRNSQTVYEKLASALSDDDKVLYQQRVDEITPNIRYCAYNVGDESAIQDLKNMRSAGGEDFMVEKLDSLIAQTREKQAATLSEVTWRGRTVPVKHEKVRVFLLNVQEIESEVQRASSLDGKVSVYESLLLECKDAVQTLRDELQAEAQTTRVRVEGHVSSLQYLYYYLVYLRSMKTIERNLLLVESLKKNLKKSGKKGSKPQDVIRMYETIIQSLSEIEQLTGGSDDAGFMQTISVQILAYKALRCYFIAEMFGNSKKWLEAIAVYDRCTKYATEALNSSSQLNKKIVVQLEEVVQKVEGQKYSAHALSILGNDDITTQFEKVTLKNDVPLVDRLDEYREDPRICSKHPNIVKFPPSMQPIPCKPLFFDLALNHVQLPPLEDKLEVAKGSGIKGIVKGWLWGSGSK